MNREELLQEIQAKVQSGEISPQEIQGMLGMTDTTSIDQPPKNDEPTGLHFHFSLTNMLYILGAVIVLMGVIFFVARIWDDIGSGGRILVTLGLGLTMTMNGSLLLKSKPGNNIGPIFHLIGGVLIPGGIVVTLTEMNIDSIWSYTFISGAVFALYILLNIAQRHAILTFFAIFSGTSTLYLLIGAVITDLDIDSSVAADIFTYTTMALGISYMLLAYQFKANYNQQLTNLMHLGGSLAFLGAGFTLVFDSFFWQLVYFVFLAGGLKLSIYLKSRILLLVSTIFLIAHVSYVTSEYFADSLGWPITLILLGFVFIGLGYGSIQINKEYIQKHS